LAVTGETIQASQHNPPLEDIAAALTASLPRNGAAPMTGPLDGSGAGTVTDPSFAVGNGSGLYPRSGGGLGIADGGVVVGAVEIGAGMDFWGTTAPAGWLFPYGQAVSRTTYATLFQRLGTAYGVGDGSTTFNLPDKRGRASFGKDNMGGTSANRITDKDGGWNGDVLGDAGGREEEILTEAQIPVLEHDVDQHRHAGDSGRSFRMTVSGGSDQYQTTGGAFTLSTVANTAYADVVIADHGGGLAHNNLPPGIVCNYIIFTGVY
jgi:microcystin-dependent protein